KLDRFVALKFLPDNLTTSESERQRFIHEAKAASSLDHPHICTIYEIDETPEGRVFIAMAIYEGTTVDRKIEHAPLKIDEAVDIAIQVAEGLHAAHENKIVHRDIKSSNIMVTTKGQAKIMDFGLAKKPGQTLLTKAGSTVGTVPCMSPEQARGETVDHRTDIWSLGVVLYEMIAGRLPFQSEYNEAIVYSILNEQPKPLTALRSDVPMELERIVGKAMQKDGSERYQGTGDILVDLRSLRKEIQSGTMTAAPVMAKPLQRSRAYLFGGIGALVFLALVGLYVFLSPEAVSVDLKSIAVLPFQNLGVGQDLDFLQLALADEIATTLSYTPNLIIRPSASTRRYAGSDVDPQTAGIELGVVTAVTGHFAREGDQLRVTLQAIDVKNNRVLWGETVRTMASDWISMEEEIQSRIRQGLIPKLGLIASPADVGTRPQNAEAYELFLRSVVFPNTENKQAIALLERAVLLDAHYASTWAALGKRYHWYASFEDGGEDSYRRAERSFQHALTLDPNLVDAARGLISLTVETGQLITAYDRAQDLVRRRQDHPLAHLSLAYVFRFAGMHSEAARECESARALDPNEPALRGCGFAFMMAGDYERALSFWKMGPETEWSNNGMVFVLLRQGKYEDALRITEKLVQNPTWPARFVHAYLRKRPAAEVKRLADEYVRTSLRVRRDPDSAYLDGSLLAFCGQKSAALELLRIAVEGNFCMGELLDNDPLLENVRSTPEFAAIRAAGFECRKKFLEHRGR
ncbi:MAG: protein kinase, partial [Bacteroidota bacterium]